MKWKDALREYKQYMIVEKGYSQNTIDSYMRDLLDFFNVKNELVGKSFLNEIME